MKKERLFAFLLAGVTAAGTLTAGTTVQASETTVNLNIEKQNTSSYTLTVPAEIALEASGDRTEWSEGITITGSSDKNVKVTAKSANDWNLANDTKKIGYHLYKDHDGDETMTELVFEASEINEANQYNSGVTKRPFIQVNAEDLANAVAGEYSDVLTFTAETVEDGGDSGNTGTFAGWKEGDTIVAEFSLNGNTYTRTYQYVTGGRGFEEVGNSVSAENFVWWNNKFLMFYEGGKAIFRVDPDTKNITTTLEEWEEQNVTITSLKVNGEEWINSSTSGGEGGNEPEEIQYTQVTSDNIEELLGQYKDSTDKHIFGKAQDEDTAYNQAEEVANELYSKGQSDGLTELLVIYKYDGTKKLYYGFRKASWIADSTDKEYRMISDEVSAGYTIYVLK